MTLITPEHTTQEADEFYQSLKDEVSGLRRQLVAQRKLALSGEDIDVTASTKILQLYNDAIGRCHKVELSISEIQNKRNGIARGGYALDLGEATAKVRCALDSLRRCQGTGNLSE